MNINGLLDILNKLAPFSLQESYDNSGIQFADREAPIIKILLALDLTSEILTEALENKVNVILTHHPLLFAPLKQITKQHHPLLFQTITRQINLLALHTNYDLAENGLNDYVASLLRITKIAPLKSSLEKIYKFAIYVPIQEVNRVSQAIFEAGAGKIGQYTETSFQIKGEGGFKPLEGAKPFIGKIGEREAVEEIKIETIVPERNLEDVIEAMKKAHPYEEPAYDIYELKIKPSFGIGFLGEITEKADLTEFSISVKNKLKASYIRLIKSNHRPIKKVTLCCGGGSSLLEEASKSGTDLYITGDINYHSALRAKELGLNILEIEHYDTEKFFVEALYHQLIEFKITPDILMKSKKMASPYQLL